MLIKKAIVAILLFTLAPLAWSNERTGKWDLSLGILYQGAESVGGGAPPGLQSSSLEISDDWGFAINFGYNITSHWALSFDMSFLTPSYKATVVPEDPAVSPETVSHSMDMFSGVVRGTYNILSGPITPFIDLSAGFTYIDSNVVDRPPTTGCWWDPWWGYVCSSFVSTYSDTRFNYGGGLGVRWDLGELFLRATYSVVKIDFSNSDDPTFGVGRLDVGWTF